MLDTEPRVLPHVEGVRNPKRQAIAAALRAEIKAQGLTVKCLSKVATELDPTLGYMPLLNIVRGVRDPTIDQLATICNVLAVRIEDLAATAAESTK